MYLHVEEGVRATRTVVAGVDLASAHAAAKRLCVERGATMRVVDHDTEDGRPRVIYTYRPQSIVRRRACDCPPRCWGSRREQHAIKCRPARPRCRWRRRENGLCHCVAYHYPHREGSGLCIEGPNGSAKYEESLRQPKRRAA